MSDNIDYDKAIQGLNNGIDPLNGITIDIEEYKKLPFDIEPLDDKWTKSKFMSFNDSVDLDAGDDKGGFGNDYGMDTENVSDFLRARTYTTASDKFVSAQMGGNVYCNAKPQFTRYCDPRVSGRLGIHDADKVSPSNASVNNGMGRTYSEMLDDNAQIIYIEAGIPKFNGWFSYMSKAHNYKDTVIANSGRSSIGYDIGKAVGMTIMAIAFPILTLTLYVLKKGVELLQTDKEFAYYYLDPRMDLYWALVSELVTQLMTEMGILIPTFMEDKKDEKDSEKKLGYTIVLDKSSLEEFRVLMPDVFNEDNYFDVYALVTRSQRLANEQMFQDATKYQGDGVFKYSEYVKNKDSNLATSKVSFGDYVNSMLKIGKYSSDDGVNSTSRFYGPVPTLSPEAKEKAKIEADLRKKQMELIDGKTDPKDKDLRDRDGNYPAMTESEEDENKEQVRKAKGNFGGKTLDSAIRGGGGYAIFEVNFVGTSSESFSNSFSDIPSSEKLNQLGKKAKDAKFSFAGGVTGSDTIDKIITGAKDVVMGVASAVTFGISDILAGASFMNLGKKWDDSSVTLPTNTYTCEFNSPYNNPISDATNMYIPLMMLIGLVVPRSTGGDTYTSPFLASLYCKGFQTIKKGMLVSLDIERGTNTLSMTRDRKMRGIKVTFKIADFSGMTSAATNASIFEDLFKVGSNDHTLMGQYIATLASRDFKTTKYNLPKIKLNLSRAVMKWDRAFSGPMWEFRVGNSLEKVVGPALSSTSLVHSYDNA